MLHEDTEELKTFFKVDVEVATFSNQWELPEKVEYYLTNEEDRHRVQTAGYERCHSQPYTYRSAVDAIVAHHAESAKQTRSLRQLE